MLLEEVLGSLGIAGGPDEEREDLLMVGRPGGHDRGVRLRGTVGACGIDRFQGRGHRIHGDETLWPSRCFRAGARGPIWRAAERGGQAVPERRASGVGSVTDAGKPKHMRFPSTRPVGAWRNGRARVLGVPGTYAV